MLQHVFIGYFMITTIALSWLVELHQVHSEDDPMWFMITFFCNYTHRTPFCTFEIDSMEAQSKQKKPSSSNQLIVQIFSGLFVQISIQLFPLFAHHNIQSILPNLFNTAFIYSSIRILLFRLLSANLNMINKFELLSLETFNQL